MSHKITVFRGDGIGPELVDNVLKILKAADAVSYTHLTLPTKA